MAELLPWLNLLLVPVFGLVVRVAADMAAIKAELKAHGQQLERHDRQFDQVHARAYRG